MTQKIISMSTCKFYESIRNRFNMATVLREGDYVYDIESGIEWKLLQDVNLNGVARSLCTFSPENNEIKLGTPMDIIFLNEKDRLLIKFKRGMNPNRRF